MAGRLEFHQKWPKNLDLEKRSILIFDSRFKTHPGVRRFPVRYAVKAGEELKNLRKFPAHMEALLKLSEKVSAGPLAIVALGGGSVGDFAGFVASIFKRGVELVHVPSTWLASIDSAHGGKTALNVGGIKNQIGTFYSASRTILIKELLEAQPVARNEEALGEILKIGLLQGGSLWKKIARVPDLQSLRPWEILKPMIEGKLRIVKKDPLEQKGLRHLLNLGHTLGHVFEAELKIPHGTAVLWGLGFSLQWSREKGLLSDKALAEILSSPLGFLIPAGTELGKNLKRLKKPKTLLRQDKKKRNKNSLRFVFARGPGRPLVELVSIDDIVKEIKRQSS